jgi:hypothetical protein
MKNEDWGWAKERLNVAESGEYFLTEVKRNHPITNEEMPNLVFDINEIMYKNDPSQNKEYMKFMLSSTEAWFDYFKKELYNNTFKEMIYYIKEFHRLKESGKVIIDINELTTDDLVYLVKSNLKEEWGTDTYNENEDENPF